MGRPPKRLPKDLPLALGELTDKQADILAWVYRESSGEVIWVYRESSDESILWSAKAYLGRSPGRSEAATLSKRVKGLVDRGALSRSGRNIELTYSGEAFLYAYAMKNRDKPEMNELSLRLELDRVRKDLEALVGITTASIRHLGVKDETRKLSAALQPLRTAILERGRSLRERLAELGVDT